MKSYFRVMLGRKSAFAEECFVGNYIGANLSIPENLTGKLPEEWREFNKVFIPVFLRQMPEKSKISAGLACGALWTIAKGIKKGDVLLCPDGSSRYRVCEVEGDYIFQPGAELPHRRPVRWLPQIIDRADMSEALQNSSGSIGTVSDITKHHDELEKLIGGIPPPVIIATDATVEDPSAFALEKHLEDFLVQNWTHTELGKEYDIYIEEGEAVGQQYPTDTGPIDILAISKDKRRLLVVELKKGRATDVVVGQVLRYMGFVQEELAEENQTVQGAIIALEDDQRVRRALSVTPNIIFYRYQIIFKLVKA
jgi:restriction system protein